jgi:hypothetical protein
MEGDGSKTNLQINTEKNTGRRGRKSYAKDAKEEKENSKKIMM